jgi:hypothetical protein
VDDELRAVVGGDIPLHAPDRGAPQAAERPRRKA